MAIKADSICTCTANIFAINVEKLPQFRNAGEFCELSNIARGDIFPIYENMYVTIYIVQS